MGNQLHISQKEIDKQAGQIFRLVKYGESGVGVCYPGCIIDYSVKAFISSLQIRKKFLGKHNKKHFFILIRLNQGDSAQTFVKKVREYIENDLKPFPPDMTLTQICISLIDQGFDPYFFLFDADLLPISNLQEILDSLYQPVRELPKVGGLVFFETNIYSPELEKILNLYPSFRQNILTFPVYSHKESVAFLQTLADSWGLKPETKLLENIANSCGGCLWLLKEALRFVRDTQVHQLEKILHHHLMEEKIKLIFDRMTEDNKRALAQICFSDSQKIKSFDQKFLIETGVIAMDPKPRLNLPLFSELLRAKLNSQTLTLKKSDQIIFNNQQINHQFTPSERNVLITLISNKGKTISRETIAQKLWGNELENKYSDWAIDKIISRLRRILVSLGLSKNFIQTKKKHGFLVS